MIKSSQRSRASSSRNSLEESQKSNQRSRRSSFVQNLILQYKNQSQKKGSNRVDISNQQINTFKASSQTKKTKVSYRENALEVQNADAIAYRLKMDRCQQQIHFPLKEVNVLQKYKSTQMKSNQQIARRLSRKGTQIKKKEQIKIIPDFQSQYESQFLKTMFCGKNNMRNSVKEHGNNVEKRNSRPASKNSQIDALFNQDISSRGADLQLRVSGQTFLKNFEACIGLILSGKNQEGLNLLLRMKKNLKEFVQMHQLSTENMKQIERRQFLTLFLYIANLSSLRQQFSMQDFEKSISKLTKKYLQMLSSMNEDQSAEINICFVIAKLIRIGKIIGSTLNSNNLLGTTLKDKVIDQLKFCRQTFSKVYNKSKQSNDSNLPFQQFISFLQIFSKDIPLTPKEKQDFSLIPLNSLISNLQNAFHLYKSLFFDYLQSKKPSISQNTFNNCNQLDQFLESRQTTILNGQRIPGGNFLEILLLNTMSDTESIIWDYLCKCYSQIVQLGESTKGRLNIHQYLKRQGIWNQSLLLRTNSQSNQNHKNRQKSQISIANYEQFIKTTYLNRIQQVVLMKTFLELNKEFSPLGNQVLNCKNQKMQIKFQQRIIESLEKQLDSLQKQNEKNITQGSLALSSEEDIYLSQQRQLRTAITFPIIFIAYHSVLENLVSSQFNHSNSDIAVHFFKRLKRLQDLKSSICELKQHQKLFLEQRIESESSQNYQTKSLRQLKMIQENTNTEVKALECWLDSQLIKIYFQLGQLPNAMQIILKNFQRILSSNSSLEDLCNRQINGTSKTNQQNGKNLNWQSFYANYSRKKQIFFFYVSWKSLQLSSELNLSTAINQKNHNFVEQDLTFISQIYLNIFYQKLKNLTNAETYQIQGVMKKIIEDIFQVKITPVISADKQKNTKYALLLKNLIQIHVSIQMISQQSNLSKSQNNNGVMTTFNDEDQLDWSACQQEIESKLKGDNVQDNGSFYSQRMEPFSRQNPRSIQYFYTKKLNYREEIRKILDKIQRPIEFYINSVNVQIAQTLEHAKFEQLQTQDTLRQLSMELKQEFETIIHFI